MFTIVEDEQRPNSNPAETWLAVASILLYFQQIANKFFKSIYEAPPQGIM